MNLLQLLPSPILILEMRRRYQRRINKESQRPSGYFNDYVNRLKQSPLAIETDAANEQHYEIPAEFYSYCLGPKKKYSGCYFKNDDDSLETAEEAMLTLYCERGQFSDGQSVLELGCGWGSLTLFMAKKYPNSSFTAVSNSHSQKIYIDAEAKKLGLNNIQIITADINRLKLDQTYDRIVSIEMFEHIRNYDLLFLRLSDWLNDDGLCFIHVFGHARYPYTFDVDSTRKKASSWTARNFFTGGQMPSKDLFSNFDTHLQITQTWDVDGRHYEKTSRAWLENLTRNKDQVIRLFDSNSPGKGKEIFTQWRIFYLAIAELFGFRNGTEWQVYHYLLKKRVSSSPAL